MKKLYFLLLFFTTITKAQIVNIPDTHFKHILTNTNCVVDILNGPYSRDVDTNNDGQIQVSEAETVLWLYVSENNIQDLTGINAFVNLKGLRCHNNLLTSLDVSALTQLEELECSHNQITDLNVSGLSALRYMTCVSNNIVSLNASSLTNIEYLECGGNPMVTININGLQHLKELDCFYNDLTSLDLSGVPALEIVDLGYNELTGLNLSGLVHLKKLNCESNNLASLNLVGLVALKNLSCFDNPFTTIDLSGLESLESIECHSVQLTSLDLSGLHNLKRAYLGSSTHLTDLNVSDLPNLETLSCSWLQMLTTLDVSDSPHLTSLDCHNMPNLRTLFIKNGSNEYLNLDFTFALEYVCADENQIAGIQHYVDTDMWYSLYNPNLVVNSYCSIEPGGDFNTIAGTVRFDADSNGCDTDDTVLHHVKIALNDGIEQGAAFTNTDGQYAFYTQAGNFTLTPSIENPDWFNFSPPTVIIPFPDNNDNAATQNFCITPNGFHPDIEVMVLPLTNARPGFTAAYQIIYKNKGNYNYNEGIVGFQFDDAVLDYVGANLTPTTQTNGQLNWNFSNLLPFESRSIILNLRVNSPMDTPAVNIGDTFDFTASSFPSEVDETPLDNTFTYHQTIVGSFDPNDKTCLDGEVISAENIGKYLHYNINFENAGTAAAENIVVKDMIDTSKFDMSSLQILDAPSATSIRVSGNKLEVIFENINLAPQAYGHVLFKIKTKPDLPIGTSVSNQASIYFDYNFPIQTNTATSTFQLLGNENFQETSVAVYPNPTSAEVFVTARHLIQSIQIFDAQGRIIQTSFVNDTKTKLEIANYSKGIYFLRVATEKGFQIEKIVKE